MLVNQTGVHSAGYQACLQTSWCRVPANPRSDIRFFALCHLRDACPHQGGMGKCSAPIACMSHGLQTYVVGSRRRRMQRAETDVPEILTKNHLLFIGKSGKVGSCRRQWMRRHFEGPAIFTICR